MPRLEEPSALSSLIPGPLVSPPFWLWRLEMHVGGDGSTGYHSDLGVDDGCRKSQTSSNES